MFGEEINNYELALKEVEIVISKFYDKVEGFNNLKRENAIESKQKKQKTKNKKQKTKTKTVGMNIVL